MTDPTDEQIERLAVKLGFSRREARRVLDIVCEEYVDPAIAERIEAAELCISTQGEHIAAFEAQFGPLDPRRKPLFRRVE